MLRRFTALLLAAALCAGLAACEKQPAAQVTDPLATQPAVTVDTAEMFTHRDLDGSLAVLCETAHGIVSKDDLKITGGTFIALGAVGMAMNFGTESTQGAILCSLNGTAPAGTEVSVKDSKGNILASYTSQKTFQSILISAPGMEKGETYTVSVGTASAEFTLDSIIYGSGSGMGGGRPGR